MILRMVLVERLKRQGLIAPVRAHEDYLTLFSLLQPVAPPYFSYPGSPPSLTHRSVLADIEIAEQLRGQREVVKGRFLDKTIGYVLKDDLELYANAFQRPLTTMNCVQQQVYDALAEGGPLSPRQIGEETGLLNKEVAPALHRLQEAFLVYEDQLTTDWKRGWYIFESEWPEITIDAARWEDAASEVLLRFLKSHVFATARQMKDWSGWAMNHVKRLLAGLETQHSIVHATVAGLGEGWCRSEDTNLQDDSMPPTVFMLHKADPLTRSHRSELKERYKGLEVLQYLLIDGVFQGAALGHWRIGPHDVDDIVLDLSREECSSRREDIIRAVADGYHPPFSRIRKYAGQEIH